MLLVSTTRIIPGRAVPSFLSGRYPAVKVRKKLYVTMLKAMPTDDDVEGLFAMASKPKRRDGGTPDEYGAGVAWGEFHTAVEYRQ